MPSPRADEIHVILVFCDKSTQDEQYETGLVAKLSARDRFIEAADDAKLNYSIIMRPPHVVRAEFRSPDLPKPLIENFGCPCKDKEKISV